MNDDEILSALALPTHDAAQTVLQHRIVQLLERLVPGADFTLDVIVNSAGSVQRLGGTDSPGVVRCIHNPTAAPVTLRLFDGAPSSETAALALFSADVAAGESRPVFLPFGKDLVATRGTGLRLYGRYRR